MIIRPLPAIVGISLLAGSIVLIAANVSWYGTVLAGALLLLLLFPMVVFASRNPKQWPISLIGGLVWAGLITVMAVLGPKLVNEILH